MSDADEGIDKQRVLASINDPNAISYSTAPAAAPTRMSSATRRAITLPPSPWTHRSEISAIVVTFVSLIWITAGVAGGAGTPLLLGIFFGVAALAIWLLEVWSGD